MYLQHQSVCYLLIMLSYLLVLTVTVSPIFNMFWISLMTLFGMFFLMEQN